MKKVIKMITIIVAVAINLGYTTNAQVSINTDGSSADPSAMLDVKSTDKGLLPPRVANVDAVSSPAEGLLVYDEFNHCMRCYNGNEWSDCMGVDATCPTQVTDTENNTYDVVKIGTQCWMAENLNIGTMINGSSSQTDNSTIEKYCYNNNTSNCDTYGGLYQWDEAMQYVTTAGTQGICPSGWHLPTDAEYKTMEMYLGMTQAQANADGWRGTDEGSKLAGNEPLWTDGNLDQNANFGTSGFTGIPGGFYYPSGSFGNQGNMAYLWSSSENGSDAWNRGLLYNHAEVNRYYDLKSYGFSVRCVKD